MTSEDKLPAGIAGTTVEIFFTSRGEAAGVIVTGPDGVWWRAGDFMLPTRRKYVPEAMAAAPKSVGSPLELGGYVRAETDPNMRGWHLVRGDAGGACRVPLRRVKKLTSKPSDRKAR